MTWDPSKLVDNDNIYPTPSQALPAYQESYVDQTFGVTVTRISDDDGKPIAGTTGKWGKVNRHGYSTRQAWNCNQSKLFLDTIKEGQASGGGVIVEGEPPYAPLGLQAGVPSGGYYIWHPSDPDLTYYASGAVFGTWNPLTGVKKTIRTFSGYSSLAFGPGKGAFAADKDMIVLTGTLGGQKSFFAYRVSTDEKFPDIAFSSLSSSGAPYARIAADGETIVCNWEDEIDKVVSLEGELLQTFDSSMVSHYDTALDSAGDSFIVGRSRGCGVGGEVYKADTNTGELTKIQTRTGYATHTSARGVDQEGEPWVLVTFENDSGNGGKRIYNDEAVLMRMDGTKNCRVGHLRSTAPGDYESEIQACLSPTADRFVSRCAWGNPALPNPRPINTFVYDWRALAGNGGNGGGNGETANLTMAISADRPVNLAISADQSVKIIVNQT